MGERVTRSVPWWETSVVHCALCSQIFPTATWVSDETPELRGTAREYLHDDYWIPWYGPKKARA